MLVHLPTKYNSGTVCGSVSLLLLQKRLLVVGVLFLVGWLVGCFVWCVFRYGKTTNTKPDLRYHNRSLAGQEY